MRSCVRCGTKCEDKVNICDNCGFDFVKYELESKAFHQEEDPIVEKNEKINLIDYPIFCFIFGILAILSSLMFIASEGIVLLYLVVSVLLVIVNIYFSAKPAKVKLKEVKIVGKWMGNIAVAMLIFKLAFEMMGLFIR